MNYKLKVLDFTEDQVIFQDEKGSLIYWPKNNLNELPKIGEVLFFSINTRKIDILNELLSIDNDEDLKIE